ncbi:MAG: CRISPR-associated protein Cas4 [Candidatus Bathyarchaeia archaeon]
MCEEEALKYIPAKWIEIYHYCPRIIYFIGVLSVKERITEYMLEGRKREEAEEEKEERRRTVLAKRKEKILAKWVNVKLCSEKLGLIGEMDLAIQTENGIKVIEIKNTEKEKLIPGYLYQATAYAMLFEEEFKKPVKTVIIYHTKSDKLFEVNLNEELRNHVKWTIKRIKEIIEKEKLPRIMRVKECRGCGYYQFCRHV